MYRVLIIPSFYPTAEAPRLGTFFRDHAEMLQRAGLRVDVACVEVRSLRQLRPRSFRTSHFQSTLEPEQGVKVARLHGWNPLAQTVPGGMVWARLAAEFAVRHATRRGRPDLIHAHNALWGGEAARIAAARLGVPFVVTEHQCGVLMKSLGRSAAACARRTWRCAREVCAVSRALADAIAAHGISKVNVIGNPIDTDFFTLPPRDYSVPGPGELLVVANLVPGKRIDHLLQALHLACREDAMLRLNIVGEGMEHGSLVRLVDELGLVDKVRFLGALDRTGVREAMWHAGTLVSSSAYETFGMAIAEALSTGLPVVATRCGGADDILRGGVGTLVERDRIEPLADALRAKRDIDRRSRIARREHVRGSFSGDVIAAAYLSLYQRVLSHSFDGGRVTSVEVSS